MKKRLVVLSFAMWIAVSFSFTACGSKDAAKSTAPAKTETKAPDAKAAGPVKTIKLASVNARTSQLGMGLAKMGELINKEGNGAIKAEVFNDGMLGDERRCIEGAQIGSIHITTPGTAIMTTFTPAYGAWDVPYLFPDNETAWKVLDGPVGQKYLDMLPEKGLVGVVFFENGFRHLSNSKRAVTTLEDIKGLKVRVPESPVYIELWKSLGANVVPMSVSQLYTALEQKVVDGQENPLSSIMTYKFDEVQKYVTLTRHLYSFNMIAVSKVFWDTLNDQEKALIKKCAAEARDYQRKLGKDMDDEAMKVLTAKGVKISEMAPGEADKLKEAVKPVVEKIKSTYGADRVDEILKAVNAMKK